MTHSPLPSTGQLEYFGLLAYVGDEEMDIMKEMARFHCVSEISVQRNLWRK